jgi:predicted nuclease of predicted toxin-antitoxin system
MLKLLADENLAGDLVAWLRAQGCEVLHASEHLAQEVDSVLLQTAEAEGRLLITEDKDFGELVFRDRLNSHGVVLLRVGKLTIPQRIQRLAETWSVVESNPNGRFIVISEKKVRVRTLRPDSSDPGP